jgi:hypothetical protein
MMFHADTVGFAVAGKPLAISRKARAIDAMPLASLAEQAKLLECRRARASRG